MRPCGKGCGQQVSNENDRYCLACRTAYNREWRKKNRDKKRAYDKKWLDGRIRGSDCRKCSRATCEYSDVACLLHYLASRAKRSLGAETVANARILMDAFERQNGRCPYTGRVLTYGTAEIDHVRPRSELGPDALTADNIEWVHPDVNRAKSGLSREEFVALCCDIANWLDSATLCPERIPPNS